MNYGIYELEGLAEALHNINGSPGSGTSTPGAHQAEPEGALAREGGPSPDRRNPMEKRTCLKCQGPVGSDRSYCDTCKDKADEKTKEDTRPWCWGTDTCDNFKGPFDSREDAIDDAESELDAGDTILVGRCAMIHPEEFVCDDLTDHLERMEERVSDGVHFEDDIFFVDNKGLAQADLTRHLKDWARRWVNAGNSFLVEEEKEVTLEG